MLHATKFVVCMYVCMYVCQRRLKGTQYYNEHQKEKANGTGKERQTKEEDKTKIVRKLETAYDSSSINKERNLDMKKNIMNM